MKKTLGGFLLLAFLFVGLQTSPSDPVEVEIVLADGAELTGHILALRDSSIVVSTAGDHRADLLSPSGWQCLTEGLTYTLV